MSIEIKAPTFPESVADGTVATWHKQPGEAVSRDDLIVDIETDKVVLELPAADAGVLVKILKENGATVVAGEVIAHLDTDAKAGKATFVSLLGIDAARARATELMDEACAALAPYGAIAETLREAARFVISREN